MLNHYLAYWTENRDILLHGKFTPLYPEYNYTVISAEGEDTMITVLYADTPYRYTGKACDVHLNGNCDGLTFENQTDSHLIGEIYDLYGDVIEKVTIAPNSITKLPVPETGMLRVNA